MDSKTIQDFLDNHDYDVRKTHNGRWIDQKCTMDVVCLVSDCIIEFTDRKPGSRFTVNDIWYSDYTVENVQQIFSKPDPSAKASNEYDKYFGQPIKLLDAAGVIHGEKEGMRYTYEIVNHDILEYISFRERNCYNFLCLYIEKVLRDSGIYHLFEYFFRMQNKDSFYDLKDGYTNFTIANTPINGATECGRIFTKVLNPLACKYKKCGTERGHISKDIITQDMLLYNQRNWRDILSEKPKEMTRVDYEVTLPKPSEDYMTTYRINRAKRNLRRFNDMYRNGLTELKEDRHLADLATQMHHIFPVSDYPKIADYLENLIALTPTQHFTYAHPNNNTQYIDRAYQYLCLIAKTGSIRENLLGNNDEPTIYDFYLYKMVLNTGLNTEEFFEVEDMDFDDVLNRIEKYYD
ncbi:MAG: restriction endonuclease [Lachnospiraceae bacterium]|nr:restriction endonuclease [Lachnospiraceae bacterium]